MSRKVAFLGVLAMSLFLVACGKGEQPPLTRLPSHNPTPPQTEWYSFEVTNSYGYQSQIHVIQRTLAATIQPYGQNGWQQ